MVEPVSRLGRKPRSAVAYYLEADAAADPADRQRQGATAATWMDLCRLTVDSDPFAVAAASQAADISQAPLQKAQYARGRADWAGARSNELDGSRRRAGGRTPRKVFARSWPQAARICARNLSISTLRSLDCLARPWAEDNT